MATTLEPVVIYRGRQGNLVFDGIGIRMDVRQSPSPKTLVRAKMAARKSRRKGTATEPQMFFLGRMKDPEHFELLLAEGHRTIEAEEKARELQEKATGMRACDEKKDLRKQARELEKLVKSRRKSEQNGLKTMHKAIQMRESRRRTA